ncbi:MAG: hypothetical protein KIT14_15910 [bacterium]|nr:hypothetical protein [bacterium]
MASALALRRGFWRLTLLLWALGAVALVWWTAEPLFAPLGNTCVETDAPPYDECAVPPDPAALGFTDRLLGALRAPPPVVDTTRDVPRWTTVRWRRAVRTLAVRQATWAALVWGPFYLLVWAFAGFRTETPRGDVRPG